VRQTHESVWGSVMVARLGELLDVTDFPGFIAERQAARVGLAVVVPRGAAYEVLSLWAAERGHGVGRALMEHCFADAQARGCRRVWLITTNDNIQALGFYQHIGMDLCALHRNAVEAARKLKASIPSVGAGGIPIRHELELELVLAAAPAGGS